MRTPSSPFCLSCLFFLFVLLPGFALAATPVTTDLTPEQVQQQQWDTECRAILPFGQGDLEAALLRKLRECINLKQHAEEIAAKQARELQRLSNRSDRESQRRENTLNRVRGGFERRLNQRVYLRADQGKYGRGLLRESIRKNLRSPSPQNSTAN